MLTLVPDSISGNKDSHLSHIQCLNRNGNYNSQMLSNCNRNHDLIRCPINNHPVA